VSRWSPLARWSVYVAIAIAFAIACAYLSNWQFGRNAERTAQLALVEANYDAAPVDVESLIPVDGGFAPGDQWRPVTLAGEYLTDGQLLVRNRPHGGTSAFEVLVPFRLADGRVFLVNRGWVAPGDGALPDHVPAPPAGPATVVGRLLPGESLPASGRETAPDGQVPTINLPLVAERLGAEGVALDESAYVLMSAEDPAPADAPPTALDSPSNDPGPFLSYAIQWILFAIMGFVFIGYVIRTEVVRRRELRAEAAAAAATQDAASTGSADAGTSGGVTAGDGGPDASGPGPASARPPRRPRGPRRDRDAADEDALLDRAGR
jgi:cytochrome oxidase assembly protein ShyY1